MKWLTLSNENDSYECLSTESVSFKFGPGPGLITFAYPEGQEPSTNFESLAFGFQTFQEEAVLLRMDSKTFDDFIELELVSQLLIC